MHRFRVICVKSCREKSGDRQRFCALNTCHYCQHVRAIRVLSSRLYNGSKRVQLYHCLYGVHLTVGPPPTVNQGGLTQNQPGDFIVNSSGIFVANLNSSERLEASNPSRTRARARPRELLAPCRRHHGRELARATTQLDSGACVTEEFAQARRALWPSTPQPATQRSNSGLAQTRFGGVRERPEGRSLAENSHPRSLAPGASGWLPQGTAHPPAPTSRERGRR